MMRIVLVPMHREGRKFVFTALAAAALLGLLWPPLAIPGLGLSVWCYYFFRDPPRVIPQREGAVVSPADGIVSQITSVVPPPELELGDQPMNRVSVFMNLFNCHVNRAPASGRVAAAVYRRGSFVNASLDKASESNERNGIVIDCGGGVRIGVVQIAGLVARRIVCFAAREDRLSIGERFGLIRFGSRLDVYLPANAAVTVAVGQTAVAGETVIADLNSAARGYPALSV